MHISIYQYSATLMNGVERSLADYEGEVLLIVNTATQCGFSKQLKGLQTLYETYGDNGFTILGFPCNQFKNQEPGTNDETKTVCQKNYGVTFPLFKKIDVKGEQAHPLFTFLTTHTKGMMNNQIKWNFTKFLIDKKGNVIKRYAPITPPEKLAPDIESIME